MIAIICKWTLVYASLFLYNSLNSVKSLTVPVEAKKTGLVLCNNKNQLNNFSLAVANILFYFRNLHEFFPNSCLLVSVLTLSV